MKTILSTAAAALAIAAAVPAGAATTLTFNTTGSDSNLYGAAGNARIFTTTVGGITYSMRASAWTLNANGSISASHLGVYSPGLGVTNSAEGQGGNNQHTIDNYNGVDLVTLQFDRAVTLTGASLNAYSLFSSWTKDTDATIAHATSTQAWNGTLNLGDSAVLAAFTASVTPQAGGGGSGLRSVNGALASGNLWLIGADLLGIDSTYDAFKLSSVTATVTPTAGPVPEPATWAMMLSGFGAVGYAMRRRGERRFVQAI